jgi:hypothetical protein
MPRAVLVGSVIHRRCHPLRARSQATVPNQRHQPTERPTWRWWCNGSTAFTAAG